MRKDRIRALRDLAIAAVLIFLSWIAVGAPLPLASMKMHREERQDLVERSEIVWRYDSRDYLGTDAYFKGADTLVGLTPTEVHVYVRTLTVWPRDPDGPTLVILPLELPYSALAGREQAPALLSVDAPAEAESARLTLTLDLTYRTYLDGQETVYDLPPEQYEAEGVRDGSLFFFQLTRHYSSDQSPQHDAEDGAFYDLSRFQSTPGCLDPSGLFSYTVEFFDGDGALISSSTDPS